MRVGQKTRTFQGNSRDVNWQLAGFDLSVFLDRAIRKTTGDKLLLHDILLKGRQADPKEMRSIGRCYRLHSLKFTSAFRKDVFFIMHTHVTETV